MQIPRTLGIRLYDFSAEVRIASHKNLTQIRQIVSTFDILEISCIFLVEFLVEIPGGIPVSFSQWIFLGVSKTTANLSEPSNIKEKKGSGKGNGVI